MKIHVRHTNRSGFVRYLLQRDDGRFWSGSAWKRSRRRAALYATLADCHEEYFRLTEPGGEADCPCRHFQARFDIFVTGSAPFTVEELRDWLMRHVRFTMAAEDGPADGCRTRVYARFGTLSEQDSPPG